MKVEKTDLTTGRNAAIQEFAGTVGKTYTLSAYLKIPEAIEVNGGGAWIGFAYEKDGAWYLNTSSRGALIAEACGWTRYSTTFTVPSGATGELRIYLALENAEGTVYFDSVQLEEGSGANQYNLIENPQFKYGDDNWNQAYLYNQGEVGLFNGRNAFYIYGEPDLSFLCVMQSITLNADEGDTVMFGMEAYANVADFTSMSDFAGIMIYFFDDNENFLQSDGLPFNAGITKTQTCIKSTTLEGDCASAIVILYFNSQINYAAFQKIALYVGDGGSSYGYNGSGRLTSVVNGVGDKISYTYDSPYSPDVTKVTTYKNGVTLDYTEFTYDSNHNIETATAKNGIVTEYTYNAYGSPIKIKTISFDSYSSTEIFMSYTQDGQYLTALTDEYGEESTFTYNINKGLLTSATDPNANTVEYTYDAYTDELLSTSGSGQVDMTTTYEYDHNALTEISRNGVTYSYTYDSLNRVTESKVGSQTLVETTYNANSTIDTLTYGNDDSVEFEYDSLDRVKEVSYNGIGKFNYVYNNEDQVTRIGDLENDRIWTYNYDILSRVTDIALKKPDESIRARLEYDDRSNTSGMTVTKDGNILTDADYTYTADENLPDRTTLNSMDSGYIDYVYDSLNRVNHLEHTMKASASTEGFRTSFTYDDSSGNDTSRVSDIRYIERSGGSGTLLGTLSYTYDANGNIRTIKEDNQLQVTYTYDGLNQLVREDNAEAGYTITYAYDTGGNMTSKEYYAYTTGTPGTVLGQIPFSYGGPGCWNDQLTDYGGIPLEYDEIGNLTHFGDEDVGNIYFEWQNGRQLAAITDDYGKEVAYKYDQNGMRTQKVNHDVEDGDSIYDYTYVGSVLVRQTLTEDPADAAPYLAHTLDFIYDAGGMLLGMRYFDGTSTENYYYMYNLQGDVIGLYDSDGEIVARYIYDSWGEFLDVTDADGDYLEDGDHIGYANPIRYRGYYFDEELYMYYCQSRYYLPGFGRFISADALFIAGDDLTGANMYVYCYNNPVNMYDPGGSVAVAATLATVAAVGGANAWNPVGWVLVAAAAGFAGYQAYQYYKTKATAKEINSSISIAISESLTKIKKEKKQYEYWVAAKITYANGRSLYIPTVGLDYSRAISYVRSGGDVYAVSADKAKRLATAVGNGCTPVWEWEKNKGIEYMPHYHARRIVSRSKGKTKYERIGGHVFYMY